MHGKISFLMEPDYHTAPLDPPGILAFWDYRIDAGDVFSASGLKITIVTGPRGKNRRVVWKAIKQDTNLALRNAD